MQKLNQYPDVIDERMRDIFHLLEAVELDGVDTILDIGAGQGLLAKHFSSLGKKVTCTGVCIDSYVRDLHSLSETYGIEYVECDVENMPFADASFDVVVMSHVLEHCPNVASALAHVKRVLRKNGLLLVFVPPAESIVCAGHISVGWNVGQLMYVLLLNGFDVRTGSFIEYGYNVCAFVRRSERSLPQLRFDKGDIELLAKEDFLPMSVVDLNCDNFNGNIKFFNWPNTKDYTTLLNSCRSKRILYFIINNITSSKCRLRIGSFFLRLGRLFTRLSEATLVQRK